ncbi:hypothetical protein PV328_004618 [Microctonus aethiopoides]|uniref:peptidylprolyl isomerase n=1 Tax=Microctonus aethiopoides TaxID=144406 RepID=A0AA39FB18_9HYME|nr:hypothetical protein PV328_004618 [Microctonus aethiopoides]
MTNCKDPLAGFTLKELMADDGLTFDFGDEFKDDIDDRYKYNPNVNITDDDLIKFMNLELSDDEDTQDTLDNSNKNSPISLGLNFDKVKEKMVDLTPDGKIKKLIRQNGVGEVVPQESLVTIKYSGYFEGQDDPYDSSHMRGSPDRYRLNQGNLIWGLDVAIQSMKKQEVSIFWIHPDYAYGELGCLPLVPPKAEVMFIVQLIDYLDNGSADTGENLDREQRNIFAQVKKYVNHLLVSGADNFKHGKYRNAIRDYKRAANNIEDAQLDNEEEEAEMKRLVSRLYQNLAICYNKENMPRQACISCNKVVNKTAKTYYHYGKALTKMGEYSQALEQLEFGLKMSPNDVDIIKQIKITNEFNVKYSAMEKQMWGKCLGLDNANDDARNEEFRKLGIELCEEFMKNDNILRQPLPEGLRPEVGKMIRKEALAMGLTVTTHERYGKEVVYLEKPNYK